jgi:hypothetical protein
MKLSKIFFFSIFLSLFACGSSNSDSDDDNTKTDPKEDTSGYQWEKDRTTLLDYHDMVLLYGGGSHRVHLWGTDYLAPYVTCVDKNNVEHWFFDSFLFLEIYNGNSSQFAAGYGRPAATQQDWKNLVDYYFQSKTALGGLEKTIAAAIERIGAPKTKRRVVIGIPEPIQGQTNWGSVKDGVMLNFSKDADRITACKWYIDYVRSKFKELNYKNIELAGFYWIAEQATQTKTILNSLATYLNSLKYTFNWIPYYNAAGYSEWKSFGFNYAYLQPNYFFSESTPDSRLDSACSLANANSMDMEMEFDNRVFSGWGYRLTNYMNAFKKYGIWSKRRLAYYQGDATVYYMSKSTTDDDKQLYQDFCNFIIERPLY